MSNSVRVRFPPSPTGDLHVGNVRSALFNWAYARHTGGAFVFRIEDTDRERSTEESYRGLLDDMRWLGLDWDEGPEIGGPYGPYRQSERADLYAEVLQKLLAAGYAYEAFSTPDEVEIRHKEAGRNPKLGYDNFDRELTDAQKAEYRAAGRKPVLRFRMPDEPIVFDDLVRGKTTFDTQHVPDFALTRADGSPLYTLTNPVDDATQHITHIVRGEDLMSSTPRQIPLHLALRELGITDAPMPLFGHLPMVMGEGKQRLSKRKTPEASLKFCRERGYLPEGLKNYLALLGWAIAEDRDIFSIDEMIAAFDIDDVNANPAQFDARKCEAINGTWIRRLSTEDFAERLADYLGDWDRSVVRAAAPLVQERTNVLADARDMLAFLFVDDADFAVDDAARKQFDADVARAALGALEPVTEWTTEHIEAALREELINKRELKPRKAFGPVRVGVTGRTVSPPLFESMELLGRERSLTRLRVSIG